MGLIQVLTKDAIPQRIYMVLVTVYGFCCYGPHTSDIVFQLLLWCQGEAPPFLRRVSA